MRMREQPAVFSYLNFLRDDGLADRGEAARKERLP